MADKRIGGFIRPDVDIQHRYFERVEDDDGKPELDDHGNHVYELGDAVDEKILALWKFDWKTAQPDVISPDYELRYVSDLIMLVEDAGQFHKQDHVLFRGYAFEVQNLPFDWSWALPHPMNAYNNLFGGVVHIRRVG